MSYTGPRRTGKSCPLPGHLRSLVRTIGVKACEGICCLGVHTSFLFALFGDYHKRFCSAGCSTPAADFFP